MTNPVTTASATPERERSTCPSILGTVSAFAYEMIGRVKASVACGSTSYLPRTLARAITRNATAAITRVERLYALAFALTRTLAGDTTYLRRPPALRPDLPTPAQPRRLRARPARRVRTASDRDRDQLRHLQHLIATQPISKLVHRITRGLGVVDYSDMFPLELIHVSETPAAWAQRCYGPLKPYQPAILIPPGWKPLRTRAPKPKSLAPPVDFHQRE